MSSNGYHHWPCVSFTALGKAVRPLTAGKHAAVIIRAGWKYGSLEALQASLEFDVEQYEEDHWIAGQLLKKKILASTAEICDGTSSSYVPS